MSTNVPTEFFSKKRRQHHDPVALTALQGIVPDLSSTTTPADLVVDYECPRAPPTMPNPTVLTAPCGIEPDFGGEAYTIPQFATPSAYGHPDQIPDHMRFALEAAKLKSTFIYFGPSLATTTTALPPPPRSTTFAIPTAPPPTARRPTSLNRSPAVPAPRTALSASPASDGSSSDQLSDASTSSATSSSIDDATPTSNSFSIAWHKSSRRYQRRPTLRNSASRISRPLQSFLRYLRRL